MHFANKIIHPTKHVSKKYKVGLKEKISDEAIIKLKQGIDIGGYVTRPALVEKLTDKEIVITIYEGKNRQIRKMCDIVGNKVLNLKRTAIGKLELGKLKAGQYILLTDKEIRKIFE